MYKPPFLRRILPWLYALVFLAVAPLLLFYTAGYTYNLKKGMVERNGVLIVDGSPEGAQIWLDGANTGKTIPYTFQTLSPGWHTVEVREVHYTYWKKSLEIRAEQVTFANQVRLWPLQPPTLVLKQPVTRLSTDPNDTWLAMVHATSSGFLVGLWTGRRADPQFTSVSTTIPLTDSSIRWNQEGTSFVLNGLTQQAQTFWTNTKPSLHTDQLPNSIYGWQDTYTLLGSDDHVMTRLQTRSNRLSRELLPPHTVFQDKELLLQTTGTSPFLYLTKKSLQEKIYQLSNLNWRPTERFQNILILKDTNNPHWMALNFTEAHAYAGDVWGDVPRWLTDADGNRRRGLLLHGGEAWIWEPGNDPLLVWRQALPLRAAVWEPSGSHIILADDKKMFSLELDERDGRQVASLASFDEIYDLASFDTRFYIAAKKGDQSGVWEYDPE